MLEAPPMEGSRDSSHSVHASDNPEDDTGLELSLGLSCGGSGNKRKQSEGSILTTSMDNSAELAGGGEGKAKYGRGSGLDAALKKFLEGRLDEQEESCRLLDGFSQQQGAWEISGSLKDQEKGTRSTQQSSMDSIRTLGAQVLQEKSGQPDLVSDSDSKGNSLLFKEIQISSGMAATWGQLAHQGVPVNFMDALKSSASELVGPAACSAAVMPTFAENIGHGDGELQRQEHDGLEQQRKFQEARKKRKQLIEELKQQKKVKKEDDRTGTHGFRRPGSNTWVRGLDGLDAAAPALELERALLAENEESEQLQTESRQGQQQGKGSCVKDKGFDTEQDDSSGTPGDDSKGIEVNFMPRARSQDTVIRSVGGKVGKNGVNADVWHLSLKHTHVAVNPGDDAMKGASGSYYQQEPTLSCQKVRGKVSCQSSFTGTNSSEKKEEQGSGGDGEASSAPPASSGSHIISVSTSASFPASAPMTSSALSYPLTSFPVLPMPYSLPVPLPNAPGVSFPVGFTFPYLMQYMPPTSDGQEQSPARPLTGPAYQLPPGQGYPSVQLPTSEGAPPWIQVLQPPTGATFSTPNSAGAHNRTSISVVEQDNIKSQGAKVHKNGNGQSLATDTSAPGNHPLYRATSFTCAHDPAVAISQLHQAPDLQLVSSFSVPPVTPFAPPRTQSDQGESRSFKEQGSASAVLAFAASVKTGEGLPGAPTPSNATEGAGVRQQQLRLGNGDTAAVQQVLRIEDPNAIELANLSQEDIGRAVGGQFHRGTTDNLSLSDGLAQELVNLRPGIPPGLKFGGTGSPPDLPWVSTTGPGPNGRTICGVLYRFASSQMKIVCACHGKHMSPKEFLRHAGGLDVSNPEKNVGAT